MLQHKTHILTNAESSNGAVNPTSFTGPKIKILFIGSRTDDALAIDQILLKAGIRCEIQAIASQQDYITALALFMPHLILADDTQVALPADSALSILKDTGLEIPLIVVMGQPGNNVQRVVSLMKQGASDYILREDMDMLPAAVIKATNRHSRKPQFSLQHYKQIVDTAQEGIWIIDENLKTLFVNQKTCDMLGYTAQEMLGRHNYDFKGDDEKLKTLERISRRELGVIETHESVFLTKSGKKISCIVATNGLFDAEGKYIGTLAMLTDITKRKADEDALRLSEANLSAVIENTTDLVYSLDANCCFITYNQLFKTTVKRVYGFDIEQGANVVDMLKAFDAELTKKWTDLYQRALNGEQLQFTNEYPTPDGTVYLSYSINPIWEGGRIIGLSCFSRDITRLVIGEVNAKRSEARVRAILNNTDMACVLIDSNYTVISYNNDARNFAQLFNLTVFAEGINVVDCIPEKRRASILQILEQVKHGDPVNYQIEREINQSKHWYDITWAGITDDENLEFGYLCTVKDITETRKLELEREKITNDLLQRNKALEQFTYIISHNLRAPVANIMGLSSLIPALEVDNDEVSGIIDNISFSANRLDEVIQDLNQILQVNEDINENIEHIDLHNLIDNIKFSIRNIIVKEHASITCHCDDSVTLISIKSFIYSILYNLITNSIKYRNPGTPPIISIDVIAHQGTVVITYKDNGRGIDINKYGNELFGLYKRFDTSVEGKGMGLFMIKMQVESLGGHIAISSTPGAGTQFTISLPQMSV